ncbi:hypothetical protein ACFL6L_04080 [candidate division KSB1 bacterium]
MPDALRFLSTGKPMRINVNPRLDREPSKRGVRMSGMTTRKEFQQVIKQERTPNSKELGRKAVTLQKSSGLSFNTTI